MAVPASLIGRGIGYADLALQARQLKRSANAVVQANAQTHLAARMGMLRELLQKIGQMLSMSDDANRSDAFSCLTDSAEPLPFEEIAPSLTEAWGRPIDDVVQSIETHGLAASLGQVHRAQLHDGRDVAIKVQYPNIRQAVMTGLKMLGWISTPVGDLRRGFDLSGYRAEILRDLENELDYRIEADQQDRYRLASGELSDWLIPEVIPELSSERVLVTEWISGERIDAAANWAESDRREAAHTLLRGFLRMLFAHGQLHADPHPGNYRFVRTGQEPKVVLYDFGSVATVPIDHRVALLKLIQITASRHGDPLKPLVALGFDETLLEPMRSKLAAVCATLFEPFCCEG